MELRVAGYVAASFLLEREPGRWHTLVALDSDKQPTDFLPRHARSHLCLRFDDIEEPRPPLVPPTASQVAEAIGFAKEKGELLVSCRAGRGRSVALAYLILFHARGPAEAVAFLDPTRHRPNRRVVELGDALLDSPGALAAFDDWKAAHARVRLSDYYDEMEREFNALEAQGAANRLCS
ncbi:MAG: hypothetical protein K2V38_18230 [Gemmataceae bacterium]|nr:hypothetical protein [Gemmataceae bacterium]